MSKDSRTTGREAGEVVGFSPEDWLGSLDPIGWRFGLERITALLSALGDPQHEFFSIHVVGTNGKSSVTLMTAAILEAGGRATGCYLSPHADRWSERVEIGGGEIGSEAFARAVSKVAGAVPAVEEGFADDERVTQFEASTAVAFVALAEAGVEVGVIEAGLGGRLDATNVLRSQATVLTSIGLDHTQWLGESETEIAAEKLAVLRPGSTLVLGELSDAVAAQACARAAARGCELIDARESAQTSSATPYRAQRGTFAFGAPYLRRNLGVAIAAAGVICGELPREATERAVEGLHLPGRFEIDGTDPPVIRDAAHNPDGAAALAEAITAELGLKRPVIACLAVLGDKDTAGIVAALAPVLSAAVCTEIPPERLEGAGRPGTSAVDAEVLARLCEGAGVPAIASGDPAEAIGETLVLARDRGGVALIAGSHYLLSY